MSALALSIALLFATAGIVALAVLAVSYARAFAAAGRLREALANCEEFSSVTIRVLEPARPAGGLKLVSSRPAPRPLARPAWRAAA